MRVQVARQFKHELDRAALEGVVAIRQGDAGKIRLVRMRLLRIAAALGCRSPEGAEWSEGGE